MVQIGMGSCQNTKLVYDPTVEVSYRLWVCPVCHAKFYGGGRAMHKYNCTLINYDGVEFHFGPSQIENVKRCAKMFSKSYSWYGISLEILEEQFPEVL